MAVAQNKHLLLVEDDASLAQWVADFLIEQGYGVSVANNGAVAVEMIIEEQPDLVILDISLPEKDGFDVCREVRPHYSHPILMMTARLDETDEVIGLEMGADDYVTKPVRPRALLARIKSLLKRDAVSQQPSPVKATDTGRLQFGQFSIDKHSRTTTLFGKTVAISSNEFEVLWYLAEHAGEIISREQLLRAIRGIEYDGFDRSMDVLVSRLRKKLDDSGNHPDRIKTIWGKGYFFAPDAWGEA